MKNKYSNGLAFLHAVQGVLLLFVLFMAINVLSELPNNADKLSYFQGHFIFGTAVFVLTLIRILVILKSSDVEPLDVSKLRAKLIKFNHVGIYVVLILISLSGMALAFGSGIIDMVFFGVQGEFYRHFEDLPMGVFHSILTTVLMVLIAMHILGVASYKLKTQKPFLSRIWFGKTRSIK